MDGGKWKRWSEGEKNCQSVKLRKPREKKPLENERLCGDRKSDFQVTGGNVFHNGPLKKSFVFHTERNACFIDLNWFTFHT